MVFKTFLLVFLTTALGLNILSLWFNYDKMKIYESKRSAAKLAAKSS